VSVGNTYGTGTYSGTASHNVYLNLDHALISNNLNNGVFTFNVNGAAGSTVRITNSTVTENGGCGFNQGGVSTFISMNNNLVAGNGAGETHGTISPGAVY
jgi:hypothetical protein